MMNNPLIVQVVSLVFKPSRSARVTCKISDISSFLIVCLEQMLAADIV